MTAADSKI